MPQRAMARRMLRLRQSLIDWLSVAMIEATMSSHAIATPIQAASQHCCSALLLLLQKHCSTLLLLLLS